MSYPVPYLRPPKKSLFRRNTSSDFRGQSRTQTYGQTSRSFVSGALHPSQSLASRKTSWVNASATFRPSQIPPWRRSITSPASGQDRPAEPMGEETEERHPKGRRATLGGSAPIIKVIMAGSGYGKWLTHAGKDWPRQDDPIDAKSLTHYRQDKGGGSGGTPLVAQISFAGPGGQNTKDSSFFGGMSDTGSNSIENLAIGVPKEILRIVEEMRRRYDQDPVILIKAHSRSAVAAARAIKIVRAALPRIEMEAVLFDPVPGPQHEGEDTQIDLTGILDEFSLVYSVASGYSVGFNPQYVFGAKRIIISQQRHSAGLAAGFKFGNAIYKGSNINSMPPGVYVDLNKDGEVTAPLIKIDSFEDAKEKFQVALKRSGALTDDPLREEIVLEVLHEYFEGAKARGYEPR